MNNFTFSDSHRMTKNYTLDDYDLESQIHGFPFFIFG